MFKKVTALFLLMAFMAQSFSAPFIMMNYYINTAAYAKDCINKKRPEMHCNGKCQVMMKIQHEEKQQRENLEHFGNLKLQILSTRSFYPTLQPPPSTDICAAKNGLQNCGLITDRSMDFFHPPKA